MSTPPLPCCPPRETDALVERVIAAAVEVHRQLGPGLLPQVYGAALEHEMLARDIDFTSDVTLPVRYKGTALDGRLHLDFVVAETLVVGLQSVEVILPVHYAQVMSALRMGSFQHGLLINFHVARLLNGVRRFTM